MKKIFVLIIAALCFYTSSAQVESEFDNYVKNQRSAIDSLKGRYEHDIDLLEKEYEEYIKAERDAYNKFIKEKKAIWGCSLPALPSPRRAMLCATCRVTCCPWWTAT